MEDILSKLQNEPIALVLIAVLVVAIAFLFMIPVSLKYLKSFGLPTTKAGDEDKEVGELEEGEEEFKKAEKLITSEVKKASKKFPELNFKLDFKKKSPKTIVLAVIVLLLVVGGGYLAYDFFLRPIRIVTASQFKLERGKAISQLQQEKLGSNQRYEVALLDIRSREEYAVEHLKGSASIPAELIAKRNLKVNLDIAVYSSAANFEEAHRVAKAIRKKAESAKDNYNGRIGKIYVIKDGFEGLKNADLITESGAWD